MSCDFIWLWVSTCVFSRAPLGTLSLIQGLSPYLCFGLVSAGALSLPLLITLPFQTHTHTNLLSDWRYQQVIKPSFVSVECCLATYWQSWFCSLSASTPLFHLFPPLSLSLSFPLPGFVVCFHGNSWHPFRHVFRVCTCIHVCLRSFKSFFFFLPLGWPIGTMTRQQPLICEVWE